VCAEQDGFNFRTDETTGEHHCARASQLSGPEPPAFPVSGNYRPGPLVTNPGGVALAVARFAKIPQPAAGLTVWLSSPADLIASALESCSPGAGSIRPCIC
jgi:hypothetical protein